MLRNLPFRSLLVSREVRDVRNLTAEQLRAARMLLKWSRVRLGAKCNLSEGTISGFENGLRKPHPHRVAAMRLAFEGSGIVFSAEGSPSLARPEAQTGGRHTGNRTWRRRRTHCAAA
ncbi:XRE family transcriptional regulator [Mesorhizobium sp. M4B.F.Ca.ET.169.01.1.1]|nr:MULTISPECIES: helix-turn-helix transcriptional regulator [unclassified Mesorhizobium]RUW18382.1 XRE family transcriptional regulator [Mesorhizobium sp. M4B.F.Ca.ET.013.02.1.1]RVD41161.1 XRE family transcriptional regulator [Mesorhizobium sp. M4B.F.Ca.ET.019.03.1.1]RWF57072.1 MAG: XRE family transcriptional regulator [Mesorhizobium sp.]TGQ27418.1 XRE family transcriptional regulator [Mesorhizobium sp. M4B.F.Ca.ET.214.01.1.1]TGQ54579.1 XRE family transcriptional regulator [Mesorhizobium sp. M